MYDLIIRNFWNGYLYVYVTAWFWVQFGINSTSEWLLIAQGEAECNYAIHKPLLWYLPGALWYLHGANHKFIKQ